MPQVVESHQSSKVDVSGTAKEVVSSFRKMGVEFSDNQIVRVRSAVQQADMGVPEDYLYGHAYHTYKLTSPDGSVQFVFKHNVAGRSIYAEGTVDAVLFLQRVMRERAARRVYTMQDVLRAGNLRRPAGAATGGGRLAQGAAAAEAAAASASL